MASVKNISVAQYVVKVSSTLIMLLCLVFLTGINFIVFPQKAKAATTASSNIPGKSEDDPSAPIEEKSTSSNMPTVQEEYLHEKHCLKELELLEDILHHRILDAEELQIVHFELVSPPPKA